jgi:transposase
MDSNQNPISLKPKEIPMMNYSKGPLSLSTRLKLATEMLADYPQRPWGKASELAKEYGISRQLLYRLRDQAISALTQTFSPKPPGPKPKPKASKSQKKKKAKLARNRRLIARRRQDKNDARRRKQQLARRDRRRIAWAKMKFRRRSVHHYLLLKMTQNDKTAAKQTALRFKVGASTVRRWAKIYKASGKRGLLDKIPQQVGRPSQVTQITIAFIVLLRRLLGWGAQRIAAELKSKGIANLSHQTVHRIFRKLNLKTKTYHPKGKFLKYPLPKIP